MEFPEISEINLDQVSQELGIDAAELSKKVNEFRPLQGDLLARVQKDLLGERVFNSNAIEGSTLTLRETLIVLETGSLLGVGRRREAQEALNLGTAFSQLQKLLDEHETLTEERFLELHSILFKDVNDAIAGRFRYERVFISGAKRQPPSPDELDGLIREFFVRLSEAPKNPEEAIRVATWAHWAIARIHPFFDGNGRMARLIQDYVLFQGRLTAAVIRQSDRSRYYQALSDADTGQFNPLAQLISQSVVSTLQLYINAFSEADVVRDWAQELIAESDARSEQQKQLEYMRWKLRMEELRDAFERCAAQLTRASSGEIDVQVQNYDLIDQPTWESLRSGEGASKTWYFWLTCRRVHTIRYCFFFGKHRWSPADQTVDYVPANVCLLISEQQGPGPAVLLDQLEHSPISIREILLIQNDLACRRVDPAIGPSLELHVEPVALAQNFLQDVLLGRLA